MKLFKLSLVAGYRTYFKGVYTAYTLYTIHAVSNEPPFTECYDQFTTVPLKYLSDKYKWDIHDSSFSIVEWILYKSDLSLFAMETMKEIEHL